jgi:hypothetical protein
MSRDTTVIPFRQPEAIEDPLSEVAREGARRMLAQVLIAEADAFVAQWKDLKLPDGRDRVVRHGHGPQRAIQTGVGPVEVRRAKVRDRAEVAAEFRAVGAHDLVGAFLRVHLAHPTEASLKPLPALLFRRISGPCRVDDQVEWRERCGIGQAPRLTFRELRRAKSRSGGHENFRWKSRRERVPERSTAF